MAQVHNYLKINVQDPQDYPKHIAYLVGQDPKITFVIHGSYLSDTDAVVAQLGLGKYRRQVLWSTARYDSLSKVEKSELVQFYGKDELNRCVLQYLHYQAPKPSDSLCFGSLPASMSFKDYAQFFVITDYSSNKQFVYYKKYRKLMEVSIGSNMERSVLVPFAKYPQLHKLYTYQYADTALERPSVLSLCPVDDTSLIGVLRYYYVHRKPFAPAVFVPFYNVLKVNMHGPNRSYIYNLATPIDEHKFYWPILVAQGQYYAPIVVGSVASLSSENTPHNLARIKLSEKTYGYDTFTAATLNPYLINNKIYQNFNEYFASNGYFIMRLSNYILELATNKKVYLPFADTLYTGLRMYGMSQGPHYGVIDFKYNSQERKFYLLYILGGAMYYASLPLGDSAFDNNQKLYELNGYFSKKKSGICMSHDGKQLIYLLKKQYCFAVQSAAQVQATAQAYQDDPMGY
ncbi:MAG: hypothetical protein IT256_02060 [Chitinophagaceae bacterium]|nr:hypothetical protein [Chitinophagaceae bacterium]